MSPYTTIRGLSGPVTTGLSTYTPPPSPNGQVEWTTA